MSSRSRLHVAIVTGAAHGIGAATARRLADDGLRVALLDLDEQSAKVTVEQVAARDGTAVAVGADVSDPAAVGEAVTRITRDSLLFKMADSAGTP